MNTEAAVISAVCKNKDISSLMSENVDDLFVAYKDVWDGLKSYYMKFRSVPEVEVLQDRFRDFDPIATTAETGYYLDQLKNEYLSGRVRNVLLKAGTSLKENAAARVISELQKEIASLGRYTNNVRDLDLTDFEDAESKIVWINEEGSL